MTTKTLTETQRLQALALFTMAVQHTRESAKFEKGLADALGMEYRLGDLGLFSDKIWSTNDAMTIADFDDALRHSGFAVEQDTTLNG